MKRELITGESNILGGTPVLKGTRVPVETLFKYLNQLQPLRIPQMLSHRVTFGSR